MCSKLNSMNQKSRLVLVLTIFLMSAVSSAIDFTPATLLVSYEHSEINEVNVSANHDPGFSPTLVCTWPVLGGSDGAPQATDGNYVLKLTWTDENDHKIEIGHILSHSFSLADVNYIIADVYFATESALPEPTNENNIGIWSSWDPKGIWISCKSVPPTTGHWYTVAFGVDNLHQYDDVNDINALTFDHMNGTSGTIYIDNLRLQPEADWPYLRRKVNFSGYWWTIQRSEWKIGAGPNYYSDDPDQVRVDANGFLHLNIKDQNSNWYCSELVSNTCSGYGTYAFTVQGIGDIDPCQIFGLFVYDLPDANGKHREFDIELAKWGDVNREKIAQFVCQPWYHRGNRHEFKTDVNAVITYEFTWSPISFYCRAYCGGFPMNDANDLVKEWCYTGTDVFRPGLENTRINFYLMDGKPPMTEEDAEVVIRDFHYRQLGETALPIILSSPNGGERFLWGAREEIRWCTGCCADNNAVIEYWADDSNSWKEIAEVDNTGEYDWVVPDCNDPNTHQALIRIRDSEETEVWDSSDNTFSISLCGTSIVGDENGDCYVNFLDFAMLANKWLTDESPF